MKAHWVLVLVSGGALMASGCRYSDPLIKKQERLLELARETESASWRSERSGRTDGYVSFANEEEIISFGDRAMPFAVERLASYDPRLRCAGLTILLGIVGTERAKEVLIDLLDDPYEPIRLACWFHLADLGVVSTFEHPKKGASLREWREKKSSVRAGADFPQEEKRLPTPLSTPENPG